jgi:hypothetical protein
MKRIALVSSLILLSACANYVWVKPGATQSEFAQQKYACMQQSQQQVSSAYVNQYGGSSDSHVTTNKPLFNACMNSQGWYLQDKDQQQAQQATIQDNATVQDKSRIAPSEKDVRAEYPAWPPALAPVH